MAANGPLARTKLSREPQPSGGARFRQELVPALGRGTCKYFRDQPAQLELVAETLDQPHGSGVGRVGLVEGKTDFPSTFGLVTQTSPVGAFLSRSSIEARYSLLRL